jgi:hypothetical protein
MLGKNPIATYVSDHKQFGFYGKTNGSIPSNENKHQLQTVSNAQDGV